MHRTACGGRLCRLAARRIAGFNQNLFDVAGERTLAGSKALDDTPPAPS